MPAVTRNGDKSEPHPGSHGARAQQQGQYSSTVFANGLGIVRVNDLWVDAHVPPLNDEKVAVGSSKVFVDGRGVVRIGDTISGCGIAVAEGSPDVFAG